MRIQESKLHDMAALPNGCRVPSGIVHAYEARHAHACVTTITSSGCNYNVYSFMWRCKISYALILLVWPFTCLNLWPSIPTVKNLQLWRMDTRDSHNHCAMLSQLLCQIMLCKCLLKYNKCSHACLIAMHLNRFLAS